MMIFAGLLLFGIGIAIIALNLTIFVGGITYALAKGVTDFLLLFRMRPVVIGLRWILALFALAVVKGAYMLKDGQDPHDFIAFCAYSTLAVVGIAVIAQISVWGRVIEEWWKDGEDDLETSASTMDEAYKIAEIWEAKGYDVVINMVDEEPPMKDVTPVRRDRGRYLLSGSSRAQA